MMGGSQMITESYFRDDQHLYDVLNMLGHLHLGRFIDPRLDAENPIKTGNYLYTDVILNFKRHGDEDGMLYYSYNPVYVRLGKESTSHPTHPDTETDKDDVLNRFWDSSSDYPGISDIVNGYKFDEPETMDLVLDAWRTRKDRKTSSCGKFSFDVLSYSPNRWGCTAIDTVYRVTVSNYERGFGIQVDDLVTREVVVDTVSDIEHLVKSIKEESVYHRGVEALEKLKKTINELDI